MLMLKVGQFLLAGLHHNCIGIPLEEVAKVDKHHCHGLLPGHSCSGSSSRFRSLRLLLLLIIIFEFLIQKSQGINGRTFRYFVARGQVIHAILVS
jgi:hypothetical protein